MTASLNARNVVVALLVAGLLLLLPLYSQLSGNIFVLTLFTRIVIFALAAVSLNLIMGYGGMMSFGHAAYLGIGGYAVGILAFEGIGSGFIQWPVALAASALFALVIGALSLRTRGVYFIMITLAFAQMAYYVASGLARYGGDDGLTIYKRSDFGGLINLSSRVQFYYLCLALPVRRRSIWSGASSIRASAWWCRACARTRRGCRRSGFPPRATGWSALSYRRHACAGSPARCSPTTPISSARPMMYWTRSGDLMVMVILGGMGSLFGPVIGAIVYLVLEEFLSQLTEYWAMIMGPLLLLVVLFGRGGIMGLLGRLQAVAEPLLRVDNLVRRFGGIAATDNLSLDVAQRRTARHHRPERRRQDHADQPAHRAVAAEFRHHSFRRPRHHPAAGASGAARSGWRARSRSPRCCPISPRLDNVALAAQAHDGHSFHFWGNARKESGLREAARAALARVGLERSRRRRRFRESEPWRAARARARGGARDKAAIAAARRADGRAWASPNRRAWSNCCRSCGAKSPSCWSSTTWKRCSRSPTASPFWSMAASSPPTCRRRSATMTKSSAPISAMQHAVTRHG